MSKKIISLLLAVVLAFSMITVAVISVSAAVDAEGRYVPSDQYKDNTNRLYFVMPEDWYYDEYGVTDAGAYWWGGPDCCGSIDGASVGATWPGYKMQVADKELSLYYIDLPFSDPDGLTPIVFNNFLDGGTRTEDPDTKEVTYQYDEKRYLAATQTGNAVCSYYSPSDNAYYDSILDGTFWDLAQEAYDNGDDAFFGDHKDNFFMHPEWDLSMNFDKMVYITDPSRTSVNFEGKKTYLGEWYFYYGDGLYGALPSKEMAEKENLLYDMKNPATPDQPVPTAPQGTNPNVPAPATDPTSSVNGTSTGDTAKADNTAIQTGATSMIIIALTILAIAAGAVVCTRKKFED